jgi:hypothetical protein
VLPENQPRQNLEKGQFFIFPKNPEKAVLSAVQCQVVNHCQALVAVYSVLGHRARRTPIVLCDYGSPSEYTGSTPYSVTVCHPTHAYYSPYTHHYCITCLVYKLPKSFKEFVFFFLAKWRWDELWLVHFRREPLSLAKSHLLWKGLCSQKNEPWFVLLWNREESTNKYAKPLCNNSNLLPSSDQVIMKRRIEYMLFQG